MPSSEDGRRLRLVAKQLRARNILLASWKKGSQVRFFSYQARAAAQWKELDDLDEVFR
jgi:hypothetical protein